VTGSGGRVVGRTRTDRVEEAAVEALARAMHRAWPARSMDTSAPGWSTLFLTALRQDPAGPAAIVAALLDEATLARALETAGAVEGEGTQASDLARAILGALEASGSERG
jgi:hypothetical protein